MNEPLTSTKTLDQWITAWLTHQRALGRRYDRHERILVGIRQFIASLSASDLDGITFDLWCRSFQHLSPTTRRHRQLIVRQFCLYRQRLEPDCFVPNPLYFVRTVACRSPLIVTPEQVARMLVVADNLKPTPTSPLLPAVMRLAVVILYTAGLRRGELVRLTLDDVDPQAELLHIRASKFHKSRLVPLSPSAGEELRTYLRHRLAPSFDIRTPLLCSGKGGCHGYSGGGIGQAIKRLFVIAKVVDDEGHRPRVHDLRYPNLNKIQTFIADS